MSVNEEQLRKIDEINNRLLDSMHREKWWHVWLSGALGVVFTLALIFLVKQFS